MERKDVRSRGYINLLITIAVLVTCLILIKFYLDLSETEEEYSMEKVISKDGTEIGFIKRGKGPPLLLVHGTTADHSRWNPIIPYFENRFTVFAIDRRGRGMSGDSPDYSLYKEAEDIAAVVESINKPVFLLGHSHGSIASLEACLLTDKIKKLILYEPPLPLGTPAYPPDVPEKMQALIDSDRNEAALEVFFKEVVKMPVYEFEKYSKLPVYKRRIELTPTIPRELTLGQIYSFNTEKFTNLKIPVLLMLGGDSPGLFKKAITILDETLPNSRILIMPDQQHIAMDTDPEMFVRKVNKFLME
jgi:pimeloyl-ACP methyl ester carboxylesterase